MCIYRCDFVVKGDMQESYPPPSAFMWKKKSNFFYKKIINLRIQTIKRKYYFSCGQILSENLTFFL